MSAIPLQADSAVYPLTHYDLMGRDMGITTGWLVEGNIDVAKLRSALDRVMDRWALLGGRLECVGKNKYQIRIPLSGVHPDQYHRYILTSSHSSHELTDYVNLPIGPVSNTLPVSLFTCPDLLQRSLFRSMRHYEGKPLTFWHVTQFKDFSCIGIHFSHGLFDGLGLSFIVHAVESELAGKPWAVPPAPISPGLNSNSFQAILDDQHAEEIDANTNKVDDERLRSGNEDHGSGPKEEADYGISVVGIWYCTVWFMWYLWRRYWHERQTKMVILPRSAYTRLVEDVRKALEEEGTTEIRLSTGDVITAWLIKTIYSNHAAQPSTLVNLTSMVSLRSYFGKSLADYPHNCFIPLPFPLLPVSTINALPLHQLAAQLATARTKIKPTDASLIHQQMKKAADAEGFSAFLPFHSKADEHLTVSNMSIARVVDVDWRGSGAGRVVCRYKYIFGSSEMVSNLVTIAGRLDDGGLVLDVILVKERMKTLEREVRRLVAGSSVGPPISDAMPEQ